MSIEYTAIITRDADWWLGWIQETPGANAQERTKEELLISLKEAARDIRLAAKNNSTSCLSFGSSTALHPSANILICTDGCAL